MATDFQDKVTITGSQDITQLTVKGSGTPNPAQTTPLQDWQNSAGTTLASVDKDGKISVAGFTMATGGQKGYVLQSDECGIGTWVPGPGALTTSGGACNGRLTLESNTPVSITDQTNKTTLYFTPFRGNQVALYGGQWWTNYAFNQLQVAVPNTANTNHDVFLYDNSGTLTLEYVSWNVPNNGTITNTTGLNITPIVVTYTGTDPANDQLVSINGVLGNTAANGTWRIANINTTNKTFELKDFDGDNDRSTGNGAYTSGGTWNRADQNTTRITGLYSQGGIWVKGSADPDYKRRYLGTIRTTGILGQCEDSVLKRFVYNESIQVVRKLRVSEPEISWGVSGAGFKATRNNMGNRVWVVVGNLGALVSLNFMTVASADAYGANGGIGADTMTANSAQLFNAIVGNAGVQTTYGALDHYPATEGVHYYQWVESSNSGSSTHYGDNGTIRKNGLSGFTVQ